MLCCVVILVVAMVFLNMVLKLYDGSYGRSVVLVMVMMMLVVVLCCFAD